MCVINSIKYNFTNKPVNARSDLKWDMFNFGDFPDSARSRNSTRPFVTIPKSRFNFNPSAPILTPLFNNSLLSKNLRNSVGIPILDKFSECDKIQ